MDIKRKDYKKCADLHQEKNRGAKNYMEWVKFS
jgi:hypothetical protein